MRAPILCLMLVLPLPAIAWEHTVEYRFSGSELSTFAVLPQEVEAPETLAVTLASETSGPLEFLVEADNGLGACADILTYAQGNPDVTVVITMHLNAQTMNGVTLSRCAQH
ncbi:hypothetical protein GGQ68_000399 [Sagittula marina]|uniref:Uncharacterized protein n=1 Tax=Sagittula marina TaxID=943940 RepID=A0A7W6DQD5_9RHOB|nr:hypothetical protein [Sagittula marina]MBB3984088.1 hypothetical protein [Sagittula marina]